VKPRKTSVRVRGAVPWLIAVTLIAAGVVEALLRPNGNAWTVIGALGMTIPVLWCRRYPISAVVVGFGTLVMEEGFGGDVTSQGYGPVIALLIISYSAGRYTRGRRAVVAAGRGARRIPTGIRANSLPRC
jgi:hypothetical protein